MLYIYMICWAEGNACSGVRTPKAQRYMMSWIYLVLPVPGLGRTMVFCNMASLYILYTQMNEASVVLCYAHDA